jgi:hypothetical protein
MPLAPKGDMRTKHSPLRARQRGAALATVGIFMIVLAGMAVLGVDVGRLAFTATETQVVADAGAVAYAKTMLDNELNDATDNPFVAADQVVESNSIDGKSAIQAKVEYAVGRFDFDRREFRPGGFPSNAVRATGTATVDNIVAGVFGDHDSTVERFAVAAFGGAGRGRPTLPIAVGECYFKRFERSDNCSDLPRLRQVPEKAENSCWTSLRPTGANANEVTELLPAECCSGGKCGGGAMPPLVGVGDQINVLNGQANSILKILADCVDKGVQEYVIPIVECGKCNQLTSVVGFATVRMTRASDQGGDKGIDIGALCRTDGEGGAPGGGGNYGLQTLALVK